MSAFLLGSRVIPVSEGQMQSHRTSLNGNLAVGISNDKEKVFWTGAQGPGTPGEEAMRHGGGDGVMHLPA